MAVRACVPCLHKHGCMHSGRDGRSMPCAGFACCCASSRAYLPLPPGTPPENQSSHIAECFYAWQCMQNRVIMYPVPPAQGGRHGSRARRPPPRAPARIAASVPARGAVGAGGPRVLRLQARQRRAGSQRPPRQPARGRALRGLQRSRRGQRSWEAALRTSRGARALGGMRLWRAGKREQGRLGLKELCTFRPALQPLACPM